MYLQKPDIELVEAVTEATIVIRRLTEESNDVHVWKALFDKGCEIASEFETEADRSCIVGRQRNRANYHVDNPSDYWRISLYLVFLDHLSLVEEISKRVVSNDELFWHLI